MRRTLRASRLSPRRRGTVALTVVLVVAAVLALASAYASRVAWLELKASGNRVRAAQAAAAADSGLAWALARLNDERPVDDTCRPATGGAVFREHYEGAAAMPSCALVDGAWTCRCPGGGTVGAPGDADAARQAFALRLGTAASGITTIESVGCSGSVAACFARPGAVAAPGQQAARAWADVARIPAIDVRPVAAITVRGTLGLQGGPTVLHRRTASGGLTLHAGAQIDLNDAELIGPPGAPPMSTVVDRDARLAALTAAQFFASTFRMDPAAWREQPAARVLDCTAGCDRALAERLAPPGAPTLLWLDGGLHLDGPVELGSPERPVLLVVDGPVQLRGSARIHGVLYLRSAEWHDDGGARIHGALLAENDLLLAGPTRVEHDLGVIERLQSCCGSYARMPGSWRDF